MAHVFVAGQLPGTAIDRLRAEHSVDVWSGQLPPGPDDMAEHARDAEGLLPLITTRVDAALLDRAPHLRAIANYGVGYDNIDVAAATARNIPVGNTPDVLTDATADLTFALMLAAARRLPQAIETAKNGSWLTWEPSRDLGTDVHGATLGIIGPGRIGQAVARRAQGFDMEVIEVGRRDPLEPLLAGSDFVSVHCPLTAETRHLINADTLSRMRSTAIVINTARGPIVDQQALRQALITGQIAGAALDVTDPEPLPPDDPLHDAPNLLITPHIGSATHTARARMADLAVDNLLAALAGQPMPHQVNP